MLDSRSDLIRKLEQRFRALTLMLYDTGVSAPDVDAAIRPHLAEDVSFVDPWQHGVGFERYRVGLAGFHVLFRFDFEITQLGVHLDEAGRSGRAIVDGVMHLRQLPVLVYPLRTILTYDFEVLDPCDGRADVKFLIRAHEEMWSFGDMIAAVPGLGWVYAKLFRRAFASAFLKASSLASRARGVHPEPRAARPP